MVCRFAEQSRCALVAGAKHDFGTLKNQPKMHREKIIIGAVVALVIFVAINFGGRALAIRYHHYQLANACTKMLRTGFSAQNDSETVAACKEHRAALMKLGYFKKQQFYLKTITAGSPAFQKLIEDLQLRFPTQIGKIEGHGYIYGEPTFVVVWLHPNDAKSIENFLFERDAK